MRLFSGLKSLFYRNVEDFGGITGNGNCQYSVDVPYPNRRGIDYCATKWPGKFDELVCVLGVLLEPVLKQNRFDWGRRGHLSYTYLMSRD